MTGYRLSAGDLPDSPGSPEICRPLTSRGAKAPRWGDVEPPNEDSPDFLLVYIPPGKPVNLKHKPWGSETDQSRRGGRGQRPPQTPRQMSGESLDDCLVKIVVNGTWTSRGNGLGRCRWLTRVDRLQTPLRPPPRPAPCGSDTAGAGGSSV